MRKQQIVEIVKEVVENSLAQSIYSLAKNNNGFFKSDVQANFLRSQLDRVNGAFANGDVYGNSYTDFAEYDDKGITRIFRKAFKTNKEKEIFKRLAGQDLEDFKNKQASLTASRNKETLDTIKSLQDGIEKDRKFIEDLNQNLETFKNNPVLVRTFTGAIADAEKKIAETEQEIQRLQGLIQKRSV